MTTTATTQEASAQQSLVGGSKTTTSTKRKRSEPPTPAASSATATSRKRPRLASTLNITTPSDAKILASVESKYDVQTHSVLSSSKIQKKVTSVLRHLQSSSRPLSLPPPPEVKPPVSVLRARAPDAGKLISIAEIAKREMLKSGGGSGHPGEKRWYQYIALGSETKEVKRETKKEKASGGEGRTVIEETILERQGQANKEIDDNDEQQQEKERDEEDEEDDFEQMKTPFERAIEGTPKLRAVPILSLFLSPIPIDELRRQYGEQTNDETAYT